VVQPSRFLPFQSGVHSLWAPVDITAAIAQIETIESRDTSFIGVLT
jgi:hypothetical protein